LYQVERKNMRIKIFKIMLAALVLVFPSLICAEQEKNTPGYLSQQEEENNAFKNSLRGMNAEEKKSALIKQRQEQYNKDKAFLQKLHEKNMAILKEGLAGNKKLTDAQKSDLLNFYETQYQENTAFFSARHKEDISFFEEIANNPSLTNEQRKEELKKHFQSQRAELKTYTKKQQEEGRKQ